MSEWRQTKILKIVHVKPSILTYRIFTSNKGLAYNLRFATRLSKKHSNIWSFIQLMQSEHVRFEHISVQLDAGASAPKQSTKTKAFRMRLDTLYNRFLKKEITSKKLLSGLSLLIGKKKN